MNTVGVLITTSKPGCDFEDNPSEACKLDVTSKYKKKEPSSPGKAIKVISVVYEYCKRRKKTACCRRGQRRVIDRGRR